jgi:hypothetical protein
LPPVKAWVGLVLAEHQEVVRALPVDQELPVQVVLPVLVHPDQVVHLDQLDLAARVLAALVPVPVVPVPQVLVVLVARALVDVVAVERPALSERAALRARPASQSARSAKSLSSVPLPALAGQLCQEVMATPSFACVAVRPFKISQTRSMPTLAS